MKARFLIYLHVLCTGLLYTQVSSAQGPSTPFPLTGASREKIYGGGTVSKAAFTPEGDIITAGSLGVLVWDRESGNLKRWVGGPALHNGVVSDFVLSHDGTEMLTASTDGTAKRVDWNSGAVLSTYAFDSPVAVARFSLNGRQIVTGHEDGTVRLWETETGTLLQTFPFPQYIQNIEFLDETRLVLLSYRERGPSQCCIFNMETGEATLLPATRDDYLTNFTLSPDRTRLLLFSSLGTREFDLQTQKVLRAFSSAVCGAYSPDGGEVIVGFRGHGKIQIKVASGTKTKDSLQTGTRTIAFSNNGQSFLSVHPYSLLVWNHSTDAVEQEMDFFGLNTKAAISPDGNTLVSGLHEPRFWNAATGVRSPIVGDYKETYFLSYAFAPDGTTLFGFSGLLGVYAWNPENRSEKWNYPLSMCDWAVSGDGRRMVLSDLNPSKEPVRVLDTQSGQVLFKTDVNSDAFNFVAITDDGNNVLVIPSTGYRVFIYDVDAEELSSAFNIPIRFAGRFSVHPDGKSVLVQDVIIPGGHLVLFDLHGGILQEFSLPAFAGSWVFSPDGSQLIVGLLTGSILFFDLKTGDQLRSLEGHHAEVNNLQFIDENHLFSSSSDGTMRIWNAYSSGVEGWDNW